MDNSQAGEAPQPILLRNSPRERGVALILVIFVISLMSILVINLTYSTSLGATQSANVQRTIQAEYILKSAVNFARVLLREDKTPEDSRKDPWGQFATGSVIPAELLGFSPQNVQISLEIRPEDSKMPLDALMPAGISTPDTLGSKWKDAFERLFQNPPLSFDDDKEVDQTGIFPDRIFKSAELVAILIDYMDADKQSFQPYGIEAELPEDLKDLFPNQPIKRIAELGSIPGFSPKRLRKLVPFVSALGALGGTSNRVNINFAPTAVLRSLHASIDDAMVAALKSFRDGDEGPFSDQNYAVKLTEILGSQDLFKAISPMISVKSRWFQVIAKVDYGDANSSYFIRAYLARSNPSELPEIHSIELF